MTEHPPSPDKRSLGGEHGQVSARILRAVTRRGSGVRARLPGETLSSSGEAGRKDTQHRLKKFQTYSHLSGG